jgi:eukaryotic-like serine/threonine-protein kinase
VTNESSSDRLLALAESVALGAPVDWSEAQVGSPPPAGEIEAMQAIEIIARAHSTWIAADATIELDAPPSRKWRHLDLGSELGRGTYGVVYRATDDKLGHVVALKLLNLGAKSPDALKEARLMSRVRHPHVVTVHGADVEGDRIGVWMELVDGHTLEHLLSVHGRFGAKEAAAIGLDLCGALAAVHSAGLVHRDVKARNVVREQGGRIVLMDFSAGEDLGALAAPSGGNGPGAAGTPLYAAPEVFDGAAPTPLADLYSLGVLLYHLVTGDYPVKGRDAADVRAAHARGDRVRLRDARADLPDAFVQLVERALSVDPRRRYESAGAFGDALATFLGQPDRNVVAPVPPPVPMWRRPEIMLATAALVAIGVWLTKPAPREAPAASAPPAAAPAPSVAAAAATYDIQATFLRRDGNVDAPLKTGARVAPGDQLAVSVRSSVPAHVYIVNQDERGAGFLLFPLPGQQLTNPLPANQTHRVPGRSAVGGDDVYWRITTAGQREHFYVFASPEPQALFEQMLAVLPRPSADTRVEPVPISSETMSTLRGVGGLARVEPTQKGPTLSFPFAKPLPDAMESVQGLWARQISFENPVPVRR